MKDKRKKFILFLITLMISFFGIITDVYAITFTTYYGNRPIIYCDDYLQYSGYCDNRHCSGTKTHNTNYIKYAVVDGVYRHAYCSNEGKSFTSSSWAYNTIDQGYADAQTCKYWYDGVGYTGDCSSIIGYIIKVAESKKSTNYEKWMLAQASVWMYLGNFVPQDNAQAGFNVANSPSDKTYPVQYIWQNNKNLEVSQVFEEAWKEYQEHGKSVTVNENVITVTPTSLNFNYHVNNTNSCEAGGFYKTKDITIKNNTGGKIKVSLNTNDASPVYICISGTSNCSEDINEQIELMGNESKKVYLKSNKYIQNNIKLTIIGKYEQGVVTKTTYDSTRWNTETSGTQGMVYLTNSDTTASVIHQDVENVNFTQLPMAHKKCANKYKQTSSSIGTKNKPIGRTESLVCAGTNKPGTTYKIDNSTVQDKLTFCTCKTINLGNDRYVNVTLTQNIAFKYGNLTPTKIYSGGGFELSTQGITTDYMNTVFWDYADYLGDVPYYYNKNHIENYDARTIENEINNKVKEMLEKELEKLEIIFDTYDSNVVQNGLGKNTEYTVKLKENNNSYEIYQYEGQSHTYIVDIQQIILKEAFFNGSGEVFYSSNNEATTSGGNKYYIPLYYNQNENNKFKFNISPNTNLSLIEGIDYYVEAECNIGVEYKIPEIRYRTISVENPFPKGETTIPSNWREWWNSTSFQNRIKNTYNTLDYRLELTKENAEIVSDINKRYLYTDWNLIKDNGSSELVNDYKLGFEFKSNISDSYCPIGKSDYIINGRTYICPKN